MPKTKEALNKLVCEMWHTDRCIAGCNYPPCYEVRVLVDHLIANGVTTPVRCKDCKHYNVYRLECHNGHMNGYIGIDGFCSYGERKEE